MRLPSARKTGCATTITSSRIRSARFARTCRAQYYLELPKLADGPFAGYPRVYAFARELITHTAGRLDLQTLVDFAAAYQRVGAADDRRDLGDRDHAAARAGRRAAPPRRRRGRGAPQPGARADVGRAARRPSDREPNASSTRCCATKRQRAAGCRPPSSSSCCTGCAISRPRPRRRWQALQRALEAQDDSPEEMLRVEHQREAADQLAIGNIITTMRLLSSIDWPLFFERVSLVEQILREDPAGAYARWTSRRATATATRSRSWRARAKVARAGRRQRAQSTLRGADAADDRRRAIARHHVGYYLISRGRFQLERSAATRRRCATVSRASSTGIRSSATSARLLVVDGARRRQLRRLRRTARAAHGASCG